LLERRFAGAGNKEFFLVANRFLCRGVFTSTKGSKRTFFGLRIWAMVVVGVYRIPRSDWKSLLERGSVKSKNFVGVIPVLGRLFPRFAVEAVWMAVEV